MMAGMASKGNVPDQSSSITLIDEGEFARLLRRSRASLDVAAKKHSIFFVDDRGERRYPSFFVDSSYRRRDLYLVSRTLGCLHGSSKLQFFTHPKGSLGGDTPLEALRRGRRAEVLRSAVGFAER